MGSPEDEWYRSANGEPRRTITLTHAFRMGRHEITQQQWVAQGLPNPSGKMADGTGDCADPDCPVGNVTWSEALAFANLLSQKNNPPLDPCYVLTGCQNDLGNGMSCGGFRTTTTSVYDCKGFRLATDAEWEYAARAGTWTAFYDGDITVYDKLDCLPDPNLERVAWYCYNAGGSTHPVERLLPNGWGLFDMLGNADEWVNDHDLGVPPTPTTDPGAALQIEAPRARRGGLFNSQSVRCRAAARLPGSFWARGPGLGFRLVQTR